MYHKQKATNAPRGTRGTFDTCGTFCVMKVHASVKKRCMNCRLVRRRGVLRVVCKTTPRHNQRQG